MVRNLSDTDLINIVSCNPISSDRITKQFFQFLCDILHIRADLIQKICRICAFHLLFFFLYKTKHPAPQRIFILNRQLDNMTFCLYRFIQPVSLIYLFFYK